MPPSKESDLTSCVGHDIDTEKKPHQTQYLGAMWGSLLCSLMVGRRMLWQTRQFIVKQGENHQ